MKHRHIFTIAGILILALVLAGCTPCPETLTPCPTCEPCPATPTPVPTATPEPWGIKWDGRLDSLKVSIDWKDAETMRYWPIAIWITVDGNWDGVPQWARGYLENFPEAGGDHHVFGRCLDINGNVLNKKFLLLWPDGSADRTPELSGWANVPIYEGYFPDQGQVGGYSWLAVNGNRIDGIGLAYNQHISFFVVWRERK